MKDFLLDMICVGLCACVRLCPVLAMAVLVAVAGCQQCNTNCKDKPPIVAPKAAPAPKTTAEKTPEKPAPVVPVKK